MGLSPLEIVVIVAAIVLLFGASRIPEVMKGIGEGIRGFKKGLRGDEENGGKPKQLPESAESSNGEKKS